MLLEMRVADMKKQSEKLKAKLESQTSFTATVKPQAMLSKFKAG